MSEFLKQLGLVGQAAGGVFMPMNLAIVAGAVRDPWGTPYQFMIADSGDAAESSADQVGKGLTTFMYLPNLNRLRRDEQ